MIARIILLFLIFGISTALLFEHVEGFIEIKKYKVINSAKVCGDKMCSEIDKKRAEKGLSSRDIKICGDRLCYDISGDYKKPLNKFSPLGQLKLGIPIDLIVCKEGLELVVRSTNLSPACIKKESIENQRESNWAISDIQQQEMFKRLVQERQNGLASSKTLQDFNVSLNIEIDHINNQRYLVFDGYGWHRLHNVEITISDNTFSESIRTKTNDRGHLKMPWPIPDTVEGKVYHIFATDGIHQFDIDIPIAPKDAINYLNIKSSDEPITQVEKTKLRLNDITSIRFNGGMPIVFSGNLSTESEFISYAEILIVGDGPCPVNGIISKGLTDKSGRYHILTEAMIWDPSDNYIKIHAEYLGNEIHLPSSSQEEVIIVYPTKNTKSC